ncbi:MAG: hypothetical protein LRY69_03935 [Gammaproteobacteria bacterium]|nr:hypothetical protein [Gammaproteobacteria bacterium]
MKRNLAQKISELLMRSLEKYVEEHQLPFGLVVNQADDITWITRNILQVPMQWL